MRWLSNAATHLLRDSSLERVQSTSLVDGSPWDTCGFNLRRRDGVAEARRVTRYSTNCIPVGIRHELIDAMGPFGRIHVCLFGSEPEPAPGLLTGPRTFVAAGTGRFSGLVAK